MSSGKQENIKVAFEVAELIINYGIPVAQSIFAAIRTNSEVPTLEQIRALKGKLKPPEEYF